MDYDARLVSDKVLSRTDRLRDAMLIVLDLDETLVHSTLEPLSRPADFLTGAHYTYVRPGARDLIAFCRRNFRVGVWTSSTRDYAHVIVGELFGSDPRLEFFWTRERCDQARQVLGWTSTVYWKKDLTRLRDHGFALEQVLVIDDSPHAYRSNSHNLIPVLPFYGDAEDRELIHLAGYLPALLDVTDVQTIDKRTWRTQPSGRDTRKA